MIGGPLAFLVGFLTPSVSLGDVKAATRPRPYAVAMPGQIAIAGAQAAGGALRGGLSGLAGSEADYADEQISGTSAIGGALIAVADGAGSHVALPPSRTFPNLPDELIEGRGTGYLTGAYDKGWVVLRREPWGASSRAKAPNVQTATLLSPGDRAPLPRDMAKVYQDQNKGHTRLEDMFGD